MRIAVLTNAYPPTTRGGAGRIAELQVELLRAQGHEVRVWVGSLDWTRFSFIRRLFFHLRDLWWIHPAALEICSWKPDVVFSHNLTGLGFRTPSAIRAQSFSENTSPIRWVHLIHDVQLFHPVGLLADETTITWTQRIATKVRKGVFGQPDAVVSPTDWLLQAHLRRGWFKQIEKVVIPNPAPDASSSDTRSWNRPLKILFVGRVCPEKGSERLKELMLCQTQPIIWRVMGPGSDQLKEMILPSHGTVLLDGPSSTEEVLQAMRMADVLLVPSQVAENQPTVLLEAFAMGLPVIGQAIGGIPETIGEAGICVRSLDVEGWNEALRQLIQSPREVWETRVRHAWKLHDPKRVVEALEAVLKSNKKI